MFDTHLQVALLLDPFPIVATDQIRGVRSVKLQELAHPGQWNPDQNKNQMTQICVGLSWIRVRCHESDMYVLFNLVRVSSLGVRSP